MTYTYNDQAIFQAVAGAKTIIRRPIGMSHKKWAKYADDVVKALNNRAPCTPLERGEAIHKALLDDAPSMKLVDILARELKVWPHAGGAVGQATSGALHLNEGASHGGYFYGWTKEKYTMAEDHSHAFVTRSQWQAAVDALNAPKVDIIDGNMRMGTLIEMGYLIDPFKHDPSYRISCNWPRQRYCIDPIPGLQYRKQSADQAQEAAADHKDCPKFLKSRIAELEAQNIELVRQSWLPNKDAATARDRIKDLESQLEQLTADNESLSDIVVQLDDNAIQVLARARDGDGLYFTSKEGQKVSVLRSGS